MANIADAIGQAIQLDDQLRSRVIRLANRAIDQAEFLMEHGDPRTQQMIIKTYLTSFNKYMEVRDENSEIVQLKRALEDLTALVRGRVPGELGTGMEDEVDGEGGGEVDRPR